MGGRFLDDERRHKIFLWGILGAFVLIVLASFLGFFFNDFLVKHFIMGEVRTQLGLENNKTIPKIPEEITEGKFVTVQGNGVKKFAQNHKIPKNHMLTFEKGAFLTSDSLKDDTTFKNVQTKVTEIQKNIQDLQAINDAVAHGFFKVTVYDNKLAPDNVVRLNKHNAVIAHYLKQSHCYRMAPHSYENERKQVYEVDVGGYTDQKDPTAAVSSMNYKTKSKLLRGSKGNMAKIYIKEESCS